MGRPRTARAPDLDGDSRVELVSCGPTSRYRYHGPVADLVREASAMACLLKAGVDTPEPVRLVRRSAADLWTRAIMQGAAPTRAELDALWAQVPAGDLPWAQRLVDSLMRHARDRDSVATPQVLETERRANGVRAV